MNARTKRVLEEALELSPEDRALLAVALEASLDESSGDEGTPESVERAWAEEAQRRFDAIVEGHSKPRSASEVIADIRNRLQASRAR